MNGSERGAAPMQASRSKSPSGVRQRTTVAEGINPYQQVVPSARADALIETGRAAAIKRITNATSRVGREVTVTFIEEAAEGSAVLDKFRLSCSAGGGLQLAEQTALDRLRPHRVERLDGAHYLLVYIDQATYIRRGCFGTLDLSCAHVLLLLLLNCVATLLLFFALVDWSDPFVVVPLILHSLRAADRIAALWPF